MKRDPFANAGALVLPLLFAALADLADSYEAIANFPPTPRPQREEAARREADVRDAIETKNVRMTFLEGGAVMVQFRTGRDRWLWAFDGDQLAGEALPEETAHLDDELAQMQARDGQ